MTTTRGGGGLTIARNSIILLAGQALTQIISLGLGIFIARSLGNAQYGKYVAAFAFAAVFSSFTSMGLDKLLTREMARHPGKASELLRDSGFIRLMLLVAAGLVMLATTYVLDFGPEERLLALLAGLLTLANSSSDFLRAVFQAFERMEYDSLTRLMERIIAAGLLVVVLLKWPSVLSVVGALLLAGVATLLATLRLVRRFAWPHGSLAHKQAFALLKTAIPFGIAVTGIGIMTRIDTFMVSRFRPPAEVGWYGAAISIVLPFTLLPLAFSSSLYPHLSKQAGDPYVRNRTAELSLKWILLLGMLVSIFLISMAKPVILIVLGNGFAGAIPSLRILGAGVVLIFANTVLYNILGALDHQRWMAGSVCCELLLAVALNLILIPRAGIEGAAVAAIGREALGFVLRLFGLYRIGGFLSPIILLGRPLFAGLITGGAMLVLNDLRPLWVLLGSLAVFGLALFGTRTLGHADWVVMRRVLAFRSAKDE